MGRLPSQKRKTHPRDADARAEGEYLSGRLLDTLLQPWS